MRRGAETARGGAIVVTMVIAGIVALAMVCPATVWPLRSVSTVSAGEVGSVGSAASSEGENSGEGLEAAVAAYGQGNLSRARRIAERHVGEGMAQLIVSLCRIHDTTQQDVTGGLAGLRSLYEDGGIEGDVRIEAGFSYARTVQILQDRGRQEYAEIDVRSLYQDIIERAANTRTACLAAIYLGETFLMSAAGDTTKADAPGADMSKAHSEGPDASSADSSRAGESTHDVAAEDGDVQRGFDIVERFLAEYNGPKRYSAPVHLFVETFYIGLRDDYDNAFEHLVAAYEIGIVKSDLRRESLFRLGRMCDIKLDRPVEARMYYERFLRLYPNTVQAPVVQRYLDELGGRGQ